MEELSEASAALLEDVREQKLPFEESLRPAQVVHLRIETFHALARTTVDRLGGPPELADLFRPDRDFHVRLDDGRTTMVAGILAASGDAQIAPDGGGLDLRESLRDLEASFRAAREDAST